MVKTGFHNSKPRRIRRFLRIFIITSNKNSRRSVFAIIINLTTKLSNVFSSVSTNKTTMNTYHILLVSLAVYHHQPSVRRWKRGCVRCSSRFKFLSRSIVLGTESISSVIHMFFIKCANCWNWMSSLSASVCQRVLIRGDNRTTFGRKYAKIFIGSSFPVNKDRKIGLF